MIAGAPLTLEGLNHVLIVGHEGPGLLDGNPLTGHHAEGAAVEERLGAELMQLVPAPIGFRAR